MTTFQAVTSIFIGIVVLWIIIKLFVLGVRGILTTVFAIALGYVLLAWLFGRYPFTNCQFFCQDFGIITTSSLPSTTNKSSTLVATTATPDSSKVQSDTTNGTKLVCKSATKFDILDQKGEKFVLDVQSCSR